MKNQRDGVFTGKTTILYMCCNQNRKKVSYNAVYENPKDRKQTEDTSGSR